MTTEAQQPSGQYFRLHVNSVEDLRLAMGSASTRPQAEALWSLLTKAGLLTRNGSGALIGLVTQSEWDRWCDRAWRFDRAHPTSRSSG